MLRHLILIYHKYILSVLSTSVNYDRFLTKLTKAQSQNIENKFN